MKRGDLERFYIGYRELFEKPDHEGYTKNIMKAGKFTYNEAKAQTKYTCANGWARWYIACSALDSFDNGRLKPTSMY